MDNDTIKNRLEDTEVVQKVKVEELRDDDRMDYKFHVVKEHDVSREQYRQETNEITQKAGLYNGGWYTDEDSKLTIPPEIHMLLKKED